MILVSGMGKLVNQLKNFLGKWLLSSYTLSPLFKNNKEIDESKHLMAKILINFMKDNEIYQDIKKAEFKVYSQFGEDGIIQYLINNIKLLDSEKKFIEIGVENYREANTRFLLINNNWSGLLIEGSEMYAESIKKDEIYWKHDLTVISEFVTKRNINRIIKNAGFFSGAGLLSIDIDGNDYWVWKALGIVKPVIVVVEYNSVFGNKFAVTIPYKKDFVRTRAHYSNLYWGASLPALVNLARKKGYVFVGTNSAGNNAFFVRKDRVGKLKIKTIKSGYTESKYRESRSEEGILNYISGADRLLAIKNKYLYDIDNNKKIKINELFALK